MKELIGVSCFLLMGLSWQVGAYDERDLQELRETKDCEMCDLTSVDLSGTDLSGAWDGSLYDQDGNVLVLFQTMLRSPSTNGSHLTKHTGMTHSGALTPTVLLNPLLVNMYSSSVFLYYC